MKKIIVINSSLRKKTTDQLLHRITESLHGYTIDYVHLKDYSIQPCIGCEQCLREGHCPLPDDAGALLDRIQQADGIIIGTPVYLRQISGLLKLLIDRGCAWYHRSPLVGKPILFVTTTQVSGSQQAARYLKDLSLQWGTIHTGTISRTLFDRDKQVDPRSTQRFTHFLEPVHRSKYRPSLRQVMEFNTQKVLAQHVLPFDRAYWQDHGYLDQPYYYPCRMGMIHRLMGFLYFQLLSHIMGRNTTSNLS